ncbi:MAG: MFS transporter [Planctomycetota bacterium]
MTTPKEDESADRGAAGTRVGIWELAPGIERSNFYALLGTAFFSIGLLTLVGNLRPYLFNSMLDIPDDIQGRVSASMDVVSEIPALLLSGLIGAASDRLGRRIIYGMGFAILAVGYALFPFARFDWTLYAMIFITACGASLIAAMLSAVIADYPRETSRGKLVGICFFLNGLGVASLVGLASQLPKIFLAQGMTPMEAGRAAYWAVAVLCLIPMVIVLRGLPRRAPGQLEEREPLLATLRVGIAAARDLRVRLAYASATVSRASLSIISAFFFLWMVQAGKEQGMSPAEAMQRSGGIFVVIQITATLWAVTVISFIDRIDRVLFMAVASALACFGYVWFGLQDDPFRPAMYVAAVFLGVGEMSGILASQALVGQVAPVRGRGAVIGVFTLCGSVGIFLAAIVGGTLFDVWRPSAPYILTGCLSGLLCLMAVYVWGRGRARAAAAV